MKREQTVQEGNCTKEFAAPLTMIDAIEQVVEFAEDSRLENEFFEKAATPIAYIANKFHLTTQQATLLSVYVDRSHTLLDTNDLARFFECREVRMLAYNKDIEELHKRGFIKRRLCDGVVNYGITREALKAICEECDYEPPQRTGLSMEQFFENVSRLKEDQAMDNIDFVTYISEVEDIVNNNPQLPVVEHLRNIQLEQHETLFLLCACAMLVVENCAIVDTSDVNGIFRGRKIIARRLIKSLQEGTSPLVSKNLLRPSCINGMAALNEWELTSFVRNEMLAGLGLEIAESKSRLLTPYTTITPKELFYNPKEERALAQLTALLHHNKFESVCNRLEQKGLRRGFACIFYGGPGTGKTETVLQLALRTERDLMQVDLSKIRSKWVGESEQNVKAIFNNYRGEVARAKENSKPIPILFINEADAIISKRSESVERSVDKMENSLQNIILQEMENLEGILIATTNLTKNMDSAFERRFLYKIEFHKPSQEAKAAIWRSMIPSLSAEEAAILAAKYEFSGGQIENIARKHAVEEILWGEEVGLERLVEFCNEEYLGDNRPQRRIGYVQ